MGVQIVKKLSSQDYKLITEELFNGSLPVKEINNTLVVEANGNPHPKVESMDGDEENSWQSESDIFKETTQEFQKGTFAATGNLWEITIGNIGLDRDNIKWGLSAGTSANLLNQVVPQDVNINFLTSEVEYELDNRTISFGEGEIPLSSMLQNRPLYITGNIAGKLIKRILVDGGSAFNLCNLRFISNFGFSKQDLEKSDLVIMAYDNRPGHVLGTAVLPLQVGPRILNTLLYVVDCDPEYNILLGRSWISEMEAVPSTFHQCLKYRYEGNIITIRADPEPTVFSNVIG